MADAKQRWHSSLWEAMSPAQRNEFRDQVLDPAKRIEDLLAWCVERDLTASASGVYRIMRRLAAEAECERQRDMSATARDIVLAAADGGQIAGVESASLMVAHRSVLDWLLSNPDMSQPKNVRAMSDMLRSLASTKAVEVQRYREQVKREIREAADAARKLASTTTGDVRKQIEELAESMLKVGK